MPIRFFSTWKCHYGFFCCNINIMRTILIVNFSSLRSECGTYSRYILNVSCIVSFVWFFFLHIVRNMTCGGGVMEVMTCWHYTQFLPFLSFWCHHCIPGALKTKQKCDFWYSLQWKSDCIKVFCHFFLRRRRRNVKNPNWFNTCLHIFLSLYFSILGVL